MSISMGGSFAAAFSKDSSMQSMSSMNMNDQKNNNIVLAFFNSPWGDALLAVSSASMLLGIWFSGKMKLIPLAVSGIVIMFIGMYLYYSTSLQIAGAAIMGFAHLSNYNYRISKLLRIE
jgi:xanthine/uracil permease